MHGVLFAVDARSCDVRTKEPAVVRQVVAAFVVVLNVHVMVEQQALGNHQVVRFVAVGRQRLTRPDGKKDDEREASATSGAVRGSPIRANRRRDRVDRNRRRERARRTPHEEDRRSGPHEKQIGHAQRNPGQCDQQREEQRETGSRGHTHRRRDAIALTTSSASSHRGGSTPIRRARSASVTASRPSDSQAAVPRTRLRRAWSWTSGLRRSDLAVAGTKSWLLRLGRVLPKELRDSLRSARRILVPALMDPRHHRRRTRGRVKGASASAGGAFARDTVHALGHFDGFLLIGKRDLRVAVPAM